MATLSTPMARDSTLVQVHSFACAAAASSLCEQGRWLLGGLFRTHRRRLLLAYVLVTTENILHLAQPWALGCAINGLLQSSAAGLGLLAVIYLGHLLASSARRAYDARAFSRIYADLATRLVVRQRRGQVDVSRVAARSSLSREFVQFFQAYMPLLLQAVYSLGGAFVVLCWYDWVLALSCAVLVVPVAVVNVFYGRAVHRLNARLHDELEHEVSVINQGNHHAVSRHYHRVSFWRIRLADAEALNVGLVELFVIASLALTLLRSCSLPGVGAGDIVAVFRYVILFVTALDALPMLIQHVSRLRDIGRRLQPDAK
jgi:ABC-type multidrug transport system fused ATPase/permease subunit